MIGGAIDFKKPKDFKNYCSSKRSALNLRKFASEYAKNNWSGFVGRFFGLVKWARYLIKLLLTISVVVLFFWYSISLPIDTFNLTDSISYSAYGLFMSNHKNKNDKWCFFATPILKFRALYKIIFLWIENKSKKDYKFTIPNKQESFIFFLWLFSLLIFPIFYFNMYIFLGYTSLACLTPFLFFKIFLLSLSMIYGLSIASLNYLLGNKYNALKIIYHILVSKSLLRNIAYFLMVIVCVVFILKIFILLLGLPTSSWIQCIWLRLSLLALLTYILNVIISLVVKKFSSNKNKLDLNIFSANMVKSITFNRYLLCGIGVSFGFYFKNFLIFDFRFNSGGNEACKASCEEALYLRKILDWLLVKLSTFKSLFRKIVISYLISPNYFDSDGSDEDLVGKEVVVSNSRSDNTISEPSEELLEQKRLKKREYAARYRERVKERMRSGNISEELLEHKRLQNKEKGARYRERIRKDPVLHKNWCEKRRLQYKESAARAKMSNYQKSSEELAKQKLSRLRARLTRWESELKELKELNNIPLGVDRVELEARLTVFEKELKIVEDNIDKVWNLEGTTQTEKDNLEDTWNKISQDKAKVIESLEEKKYARRVILENKLIPADKEAVSIARKNLETLKQDNLNKII